MSRLAHLWIFVTLAGVVGWARSVHASQPAVLYLPDEDVTLVPLVDCPIFQSIAWEYNSGLGCGGVEEETIVPRYDGDLDALAEGLRAALDPYDVHVTTQRPPEYVPYHMLLPGGTPTSLTETGDCAATAINCGGERRNRIAFTGLAAPCDDVDPLHAALYAFGRMSGLETVEDADDPMSPPSADWEGQLVFHDRCSPIASAERDGDASRHGECRAASHGSCETGYQNGHQRLLHIYGPRRHDEEPPMIQDVRPEEGLLIPWPEVEIEIDAHITDEDPFIAIRWTFEAPGVVTEFQDRCTNRACYRALNLDDMPESVTLIPADHYVVTLEASDLHGNVAAPVVRTVSFAGPPPLADEDDEPGNGDGSTGAPTDGGVVEPMDGSSDEGCGCSQSGRRTRSLLLMMLLGAIRPRIGRRVAAPCRGG